MNWVEFVKDYAKKNNITYGEALKKAKTSWAEHKKTHGISTKKTPKKKSTKPNLKLKVSNIDLKKNQKAKILAEKLEKDELSKPKRDEKDREGKYLDSLLNQKSEAEFEAKFKAEGMSDITAKREAKKEVAKEDLKLAKKKREITGGAFSLKDVKVLDDDDEIDDTVFKGVRKTQIKNFKKLKAKVEKDIKDGKRNNKEYNTLIKLAKQLAGDSKTNSYAKAVKKLEKAVQTRGFEKASARQLKQQQKLTNQQSQLQRNQAQEGKRIETSARNKVFENRKRQLVRLGATEDEAEQIAKEEKQASKESADLQRQVDLEKFRKGGSTSAQTGGLSYNQFIDKVAKEKGLNFSQAQNLSKNKNLFSKYQISALQQAPAKPLRTSSVIVPTVQTAVPKLIRERSKHLNKDGSVSKKALSGISTLLKKYSGVSNKYNLFKIASTKTKTLNDLKKIKEYANISQLGEGDQATLQSLDTLLQGWYDGDLDQHIEDIKAPSLPLPKAPKVASKKASDGGSKAPKLKLVQKFSLPKEGFRDDVKEIVNNDSFSYEGKLAALRGLNVAEGNKRDDDGNATGDVYKYKSTKGNENFLKNQIQKIEFALQNDDGTDIAAGDSASETEPEGGGLFDEGGVHSYFNENDLITDEDLDSVDGGAIDIKGKASRLKNGLVRKLQQVPLTPINYAVRGYGRAKGRKATRQNKIDDVDRISFDIASSVYDAPKDRKNYGSYKYVASVGSDEHGVWVNDANKSVILGYRGSTMPGDNFVDDWLKSDKDILLNKFRTSDRYKREEEWTKDIVSIIPKGYKIETTGHSLGGTIAMNMGNDFKTPAVVFNAGVSTNHAKEFKDNDVKFYHANGDLVSVLGVGHLKDTRMINNSSRNSLSAHTLAGFVGEDEEGFARDKTLSQTNTETKQDQDASIANDDEKQREVEYSDVEVSNTRRPLSENPVELAQPPPPVADPSAQPQNPSHYGDLGNFTAGGQKDVANMTMRDIQTANNEFGGVGGSFARLSENKINSMVSDIGNYEKTYSHNNIQNLLGGKLNLSLYKQVKENHDGHLNRIHSGLNVLKNYHHRVKDDTVKDMLKNHIGQIHSKVNYITKHISPLLPKYLEDKMSNRLNHDNRKLTDLQLKHDDSLLPSGGGSYKDFARGMSSFRDNAVSTSKALSQASKHNLDIDSSNHNFIGRALLKLKDNVGSKIFGRMKGGGLSLQDHRNIKFHTGMDLNKLASNPHYEMVLRNFVDGAKGAASYAVAKSHQNNSPY